MKKYKITSVGIQNVSLLHLSLQLLVWIVGTNDLKRRLIIDITSMEYEVSICYEMYNL